MDKSSSQAPGAAAYKPLRPTIKQEYAASSGSSTTPPPQAHPQATSEKDANTVPTPHPKARVNRPTATSSSSSVDTQLPTLSQLGHRAVTKNDSPVKQEYTSPYKSVPPVNIPQFTKSQAKMAQPLFQACGSQAGLSPDKDSQAGMPNKDVSSAFDPALPANMPQSGISQDGTAQVGIVQASLAQYNMSSALSHPLQAYMPQNTMMQVYQAGISQQKMSAFDPALQAHMPPASMVQTYMEQAAIVHANMGQQGNFATDHHHSMPQAFMQPAFAPQGAMHQPYMPQQDMSSTIDPALASMAPPPFPMYPQGPAPLASPPLSHFKHESEPEHQDEDEDIPALPPLPGTVYPSPIYPRIFCCSYPTSITWAAIHPLANKVYLKYIGDKLIDFVQATASDLRTFPVFNHDLQAATHVIEVFKVDMSAPPLPPTYNHNSKIGYGGPFFGTSHPYFSMYPIQKPRYYVKTSDGVFNNGEQFAVVEGDEDQLKGRFKTILGSTANIRCSVHGNLKYEVSLRRRNGLSEEELWSVGW